MEKIKQNTNCRRWASLWLVMAMAVMTAIFLRGGVVVQAEESDEAICVNTSYVVNGIEYDNEYDIPDLSVEVIFVMNGIIRRKTIKMSY